MSEKISILEMRKVRKHSTPLVRRVKFDLLERYIQILLLLSRESDLTIREIARRIHATPYAVSRWISELEAMGLVERKIEGRKHLIRLTRKGVLAAMVASDLLTYITNIRDRILRIEKSK